MPSEKKKSEKLQKRPEKKLEMTKPIIKWH